MVGFEVENGALGLGFVKFPVLDVGSPLCAFIALLDTPKGVFLGWPLGQVQISITPGMWGSNQLRNLLPPLCRGPRR